MSEVADPLFEAETAGHVTVTCFTDKVPVCQVVARAVRFEPVVPEVIAVG